VFLFRAFWSFHSYYPHLADNLLNSLDSKTQKLLQTGSQGAFGSVKSLKEGYTSSMNSTATSSTYDMVDTRLGKHSSQQASGKQKIF
jgi:hypothetical protein